MVSSQNEILIISNNPSIRENVNLISLRRKLGKSNITFGDLLTHLKSMESLSVLNSQNEELYLEYIKDGKLFPLRIEDSVSTFSAYGTFYLNKRNKRTKTSIQDKKINNEQFNQSTIPLEDITVEQFRWGFTTATALLIILHLIISTWNTSLGILSFTILNFIPVVLYAYLDNDSFRYFKSHPMILYANDKYITDIFAAASFLLLRPLGLDFSVLEIISLIVYFSIRNLNKNIKLVMALGFLFNVLVIVLFTLFNVNLEIIIFIPLLLSYLLSKNIIYLAYKKKYYTFIDLFEKWFYKLRFGILLLIIYFVFFYEDSLIVYSTF